MLDLTSLGQQIAERRKILNLSQVALARKALISGATLEALENGPLANGGFSKITKLLAALGLELKLQVAGSHRPPKSFSQSSRMCGHLPGLLHCPVLEVSQPISKTSRGFVSRMI